MTTQKEEAFKLIHEIAAKLMRDMNEQKYQAIGEGLEKIITLSRMQMNVFD